jgi:tetratricopeptide (TPR) repeat protein
MNSAINELVRSVLQKDSLQDCSVREIQQLADRYPYFAAPHLLLARKLKEDGREGSDVQFQKATLYFPDPLWTDQLLNEKGNAVIDQKQKEITEVIINTVTRTTPEPLPVVVENEPAEDGTDIPTLPTASSFTPASSPLIVIEEIHPPTAIGITEDEAEPEEEMIVAEETPEDDRQTEGHPAPFMQIPSLRIEPIDVATSELSFQPFHTVDYFASQGIKFREEEKPKDKFDQQLKSFTEWLKILKKAPIAEMPVTASAQSEYKVEQLAEHSLSEREVVTEAMAEVWEKQGNQEKAIAIYRKLSLLNPSKSSYFAGLIEQLKNS